MKYTYLFISMLSVIWLSTTPIISTIVPETMAECPNNQVLIQSTCTSIIDNCLIYLNPSQCQKCIIGYRLNSSQQCQETQKEIISRQYELVAIIPPQKLEAAQSIQNDLRKSYQIEELIAVHLYTNSTKPQEYYRLTFVQDQGFIVFLVLSENSDVNVLAAKLQYFYPESSRVISRITIEQYKLILTKIQSLSPYLRADIFTILKIMINSDELYPLTVYIMHKKYGIIELKLQIDIKLFSQSQIQPPESNVKILNIEPPLISGNQIIYDISFISLQQQQRTAVVKVNFEKTRVQFVQGDIDEDKPVVKSTIDKYLNSIYSPLSSCLNRIPLFEFPSGKFHRVIINDSVLLGQQMKKVREYMIKCYPKYLFNQLKQVSFLKQQSRQYVVAKYTVFDKDVSVMIITLEYTPDAEIPTLIELVLTPLKNVKIYKSEEITANSQLQALSAKTRQRYSNIETKQLISIEELIWNRFDVQLVRYTFTYRLKDQEDVSVSLTMDIEIDNGDNIEFISETYSKKQKFQEITPDESQNLQSVLEYIEQSQLPELEGFQVFKSYQSQERDYLLISYQQHSLLKVYEYKQGSFNSIRTYENYDQENLEEFILYGIQPASDQQWDDDPQQFKVVGSSSQERKQQIDPKIQAKIHRLLILFKLPTFGDLTILKHSQLLMGNMARYHLQATLVDGQKYTIMFDYLPPASGLVLLSFIKTQFISKNRQEKSKIKKDQQQLIDEFINPFSFNQISASIIQYKRQNLIKIVGASKEFGLIQLIFVEEKRKNMHEIQLLSMRSLDDGYNSIGFDEFSLSEAVNEFMNIQGLNINERCSMAVWRMKKFDPQNYVLQIYYGCEGLKTVINTTLLAENKKIADLSIQEESINFVMARQNFKTNEQERKKLLRKDYRFILAQAQLYQQYSEFMEGSELEEIHETKINHKLYYVALYNSKNGLLKGLFGYDKSQRRPFIDSLTPVPTNIHSIFNTAYTCQVLELFSLPIEYCAEIQLERSFYNQERQRPTGLCLVKIGLLCLSS